MHDALQGDTAQSIDACTVTAPIIPGRYNPAYMAKFNFSHIHSLVNIPCDESAMCQQAPSGADAEAPSGAASAEPSTPLSAAIRQSSETQLRAFLDRAMLGTPSSEASSLAERGSLFVSFMLSLATHTMPRATACRRFAEYQRSVCRARDLKLL